MSNSSNASNHSGGFGDWLDGRGMWDEEQPVLVPVPYRGPQRGSPPHGIPFRPPQNQQDRPGGRHQFGEWGQGRFGGDRRHQEPQDYRGQMPQGDARPRGPRPQRGRWPQQDARPYRGRPRQPYREPQERANVQLSKKTAQLHQMIQRATAYGTMVVEEIGKAAEGCRTKRNRVLEVHAMVQGFHSRMLEMLEPLGQVNGHL